MTAEVGFAIYFLIVIIGAVLWWRGAR